MQPLVSIVINSYNYQKFVIQAIDSIIKQSYKNIEIIVVDDASTDSSPELLTSHQKKYREKIVKLELLDKNVGVGRAANIGMSFAKGQYICLFSSDDRMHPDKIAKQVKYLEKNSNVAAVFSQANYIDGFNKPLQLENEIFNISIKNIRWQLLTNNFLCAPSAMIRTDIAKKLNGFNPAIRYLQDYDLWLRMLKEYEIARIPEKLVDYRIHGKNLSFFNSVPFAARYETVSCILDAINNWPLENLFPFKEIENTHENFALSKEKAKACAIISIHCLNIDMMYFDRPFLALDTAYRFALKGLLMDQESIECQQALYRVYEAMGDRQRSQTGKSIDFDKWKNDYHGLIDNQVYEELAVDKKNSENNNLLSFKKNEDNSQSEYMTWLIRRKWDFHHCDHLLNNIEKKESLPKVHLFIYFESHNQIEQLHNLIDDLSNQYFNNWILTIFSELECPSELLDSVDTIEWIRTSTEQVDATAAVINASPAEWFLCAPAGLHLSPTFTLLTSLRLSKQPNSLVLYTDEDIVNADGQHSQPKLKPDINIELLRSNPYIGAATLIRKPLMLDPRIAILPPGLSRNHGAALLAFEQNPVAVDHLDEILVHVPEALAEEYASAPLVHLLVQQHLTRCGVVAEINDGPLPSTLFIDYKLPAKPPMVSIIVLINQRFNKLQTCLETLLEKTDYPNFEILVIDHEDTEPSAQAFLSKLSSSGLPVKVLHWSQKSINSAIRNFAARQAQGHFLLFLNDDTAILQENWLTRLTAIGVQKGVGAVGCRLVSSDQQVKHAGMILGLNGTIDLIGMDLSLNEPGYMGRAQLAQNFSAISAACMLVRKDVFFEVGGFDEKNFPIAQYDADLCLKLGERNYRIVWTPFVTLAQANKDELNVQQDDQQNSIDLPSRKAFIKKWLPKLTNDPAYNRHLSLRQREWMIDGDFDVPWHPDLEPLPRIVAQPPDEMGVGQYRMMGPLKELTDSGKICSFLLPALTSEKRFLPYVSELARAKPTVLFLQNAFSHFHFDDLQDYAELLPDVFRVFGQDDIVFSVPQKSAARKYFGKDTKARVRRAVSLCHRAVVTTEPIAEAMRGMVDDIRVMPNYLERSRWSDLRLPRNERRKLRVGWAGAQQHQGDLEFILPVVEATANEVDWIFMGMCPAKLRYHVAEVHNAVPFDQYPVTLAALDLDLAIAPLEINRFNTAKSNLRLLEYGAVGFPVIATDILPYRNAPITRVPNNPKAWIDAIRAHIHDVDATRAAGNQLQEWVLSNWMLDQHLDEWMKALLPD